MIDDAWGKAMPSLDEILKDTLVKMGGVANPAGLRHSREPG